MERLSERAIVGISIAVSDDIIVVLTWFCNHKIAHKMFPEQFADTTNAHMRPYL